MILVTGASGFLGQHLLRQLAKVNVPIRALYHNNPPDEALLQFANTSWMQCDLLDVYAVAEAFTDITEVYHCAAKVSFDAEDKYLIQKINIHSTANVVNAALGFNVRKLIHVSSIATLGRGNIEKPLSEDSFWEESKKNTAYARSKYLAEMEVWRAMAEGLNAAIINPAIILGAGNWDEGSARLIKVADNEFPFYTEGINGWVDVADVVRAMIWLMKSDINEERFILSEGNHSYKEIFTMMANALGKKAPQIKAAKWIIDLLWRWNWVKKLATGKSGTVSKETARTAQVKCYYDNSKFLNALPEFQYTPIKNCIDEMAKAYKASQNKFDELFV
ncbi:MAG: NAD-dependent epimerase/dehydratase family protein [Phycisphaerales bacterium]|nr:NAD-dependent epimerase/dehydratase family protein [Phycisphaerales bacterium]